MDLTSYFKIWHLVQYYIHKKPTIDIIPFSVYNTIIQCLNSLLMLCCFIFLTLYMGQKMDEDGLDISEMWWYDDEIDCYVGSGYDEDYDYEEVS